MLSRDEIMALSDAELVRSVAEMVMGWYRRPVHDSDMLAWHTDAEFDSLQFIEDEWSPLTDWNHTAQVWEAMGARGWHLMRRWHDWCGIVVGFELEDKDNEGPIHEIEVQAGSERKAILQAALMAVQVKE